MELNIKLADKLLKYPYALFKNNNCIYKSKIESNYILTALFKNLSINQDEENIYTRSFRGFLFFTNYIRIRNDEYNLITVLKEKDTGSWQKNEWTTFTQTLKAVLSLLTIDLESIHLLEDKKEVHTSKMIPIEHNGNSNHDFQDQYQLEINIIALLRNEDLLSVKPLLKKLISFNNTALSKNPLLNKKYKLIASITLLTRTSIRQGASANRAYRLSDSLIQSLDQIKNEHEISDFTDSMLVQYSNLYRGSRIPLTSNIINDVISYIHANLYEEINNSEIADYLSIHPAYLSTLFKKTMGVSLHTYIVTEKISEAQYLLSNTDFSYSTISELLHFSNQSHFCKLFKKHTSYTPKEFRIWF